MNTKKIIRAFSALHIECHEEQAETFCRFYNLLVEKNKVMNLTRITDFDDFVIKHLADSLTPALLKQESPALIDAFTQENTRILDLGTGAGFPGIPLAVMFEKPHYTLMDSLNKRIRFLEEAVAECSIDNVHLLHARAEEMGKNSTYRESFDIVTSRAVANLSTLSEYALPMTKVGGCFISYKGGDAAEEIRAAAHAIRELGGELSLTHEFILPQTEAAEEIRRTLILIKKIRHTPKKYPRQPGMAQKNPL